MSKNIESLPNPEENKKTIKIGEKENKKGDVVNFDNGDGIEIDWRLEDFDADEVKVYKMTGSDKNKKILDTPSITDFDILSKSVSMDQFIKWQSGEK